MGLIKLGKVIKAYIAKVSGSGVLAQWLAVEEFAGDQRKALVFGACNEDFAPPTGIKTIDIPLGQDRGFLTTVAYRNDKIVPVAIAGERKLYSTNEAGDTVKGTIYIKQSGEVVISNQNNSLLRVKSDGAVEAYFNSVYYFNMAPASSGNVTLKTYGTINITGSVAINITGNPITITGGASGIWLVSTSYLGMGGTGCAVTITGTLTNNGVNVGSTHVHSGVQVGGGLSGVPQ